VLVYDPTTYHPLDDTPPYPTSSKRIEMKSHQFIIRGNKTAIEKEQKY
jgi:hypothetical protein